MNKTFKHGNPKFNACVGNNGYVDLDTYADGFKEAALLLIDAAISQKIPMDIAVYPAIFNARHYLELFIKYQIKKVNSMFEFINPNYKSTSIHGHELSKLWQEYKKSVISQKEDRFTIQLQQLDEFISDFSDIDDSSETFRYPISNGRVKHLTDLSCINILDFKKRFEELVRQLDKLDEISDAIYTEYLTGINAGGLCRNIIFQIASDLPDKDNWSSPNFDSEKKRIREKYNISKRQLSKVIDKIKKHRIFAKLVGIEVPISGLETDTFEKFMIAFDKYKKDSIPYEQYIAELIQKLSKEEICSLTQLYDMGCFYLLSEEYESGYLLKLEDDYKSLAGYLRKDIAPEKIKLGMKIMGINCSI
jgi:hypothetical protein